MITDNQVKGIAGALKFPDRKTGSPLKGKSTVKFPVIINEEYPVLPRHYYADFQVVI